MFGKRNRRKLLCDKCKIEGKTSEVRMYEPKDVLVHEYARYYDQEGDEHIHDGNLFGAPYECSHGHRWTYIEGANGPGPNPMCWCGWTLPKDQVHLADYRLIELILSRKMAGELEEAQRKAQEEKDALAEGDTEEILVQQGGDPDAGTNKE